MDVGSRGSRNNHFLLKIFWEICQLWGPSVLDVQLQKPLFAKIPANFVCSSVQQHTFWQKKCNTWPVHLSCSDNYFYNIRHRRHLCISESILQDWWMLFTLICFLFLKKIKKVTLLLIPKAVLAILDNQGKQLLIWRNAEACSQWSACPSLWKSLCISLLYLHFGK